MSTAKRSRRRQSDAQAASPQPASKRLKTTTTSHVPTQKSGLGFLVDENARHGKKLEAKLTNGVPSSKTTRVDESHAVVAPDTADQPTERQEVGRSPDHAIDISSGEESSEDSEDDREDWNVNGLAEDASAQQMVNNPMTNGHISYGQEAEAEHDDEDGAENVNMAAGEASFGELLQARQSELIDVSASFPNPTASQQTLTHPSGARVLSAPSGTSLSTVLTQALKTNDKNKLESCFQSTDLPSIRSTIQRLQSQHVTTLLTRLAERIHKRPGRTGSLFVWIQWAFVAHGGYLASQPDLMKKLKSLSRVINERATGLQPLLHLKGKLDILSAQLELRRHMHAASRAANAEDEDDEEGVVYVEGQDDDWSDSEVEMDDAAAVDSIPTESRIPKAKPQTATPLTEPSESGDDMPNGISQEADDDSEDDEEEDEGMFDDEAEEIDDHAAEDSDSDEEVVSDVESEDDEMDSASSDSEDGRVQPAKPSTLNRKR